MTVVRHWRMPDHVAVVAHAFCAFDLSVQDTTSPSLKEHGGAAMQGSICGNASASKRKRIERHRPTRAYPNTLLGCWNLQLLTRLNFVGVGNVVRLSDFLVIIRIAIVRFRNF
jgi:hypothetical protein